MPRGTALAVVKSDAAQLAQIEHGLAALTPLEARSEVLTRLDGIYQRAIQSKAVTDSSGEEIPGEFTYDREGALKAVELMGKVWGVFRERDEDGTPVSQRPVQVIVMGGERVEFS